MAATTQSPTISTSRPSDAAGAAAERVLSEAKGIGSELMATVSNSANALYEEQRNRAADEIAAVGDVLRRSIQSLDQPGGVVARYGDEAARRLNNFAARLRGCSWGKLTADVEDFARQYPLVFIGAATGLGFIAGRFLTASATQLMSEPPASAPSWQTGHSGTAGGAMHDAKFDVASPSLRFDPHAGEGNG